MIKRTRVLYDKFYKEAIRHLEIPNPTLWSITLTAKELSIPLEKAASDIGIALTGYNKPVNAKPTKQIRGRKTARKTAATSGKTYVSPRTGKTVWTNNSKALRDESEDVWKRCFATPKQKSFITTMRRTTRNAIPPFKGVTAGEADIFIRKHFKTFVKYQRAEVV